MMSRVGWRARPFSLLARSFSALPESSLPAGLRESAHVSLRLHAAGNQLQPGKDGTKPVGVGDRGAGLVYRHGRPASTQAIESREQKGPVEGIWVVKIQPPLDISSDSAGGAGKITPATLLLNDQTWRFVRFVKEDDEGHFSLLKCALSEDNQVAYRYAEEFDDKGPMLRVFTSLKPVSPHAGW